jgi:hypothetical protein
LFNRLVFAVLKPRIHTNHSHMRNEQ